MRDATLGCTYQDSVTGFQGVATGRAEYLTGCTQVLLIPPAAQDGTFREGHWFDVQRLKHMDKGRIIVDNSETPGPDKEAPKK